MIQRKQITIDWTKLLKGDFLYFFFDVSLVQDFLRLHINILASSSHELTFGDRVDFNLNKFDADSLIG